MKFTTVYLENNKIELFNSFLGKETIKLNNEVVSEKKSILGTEHFFKIEENGNEIECKLVTGFGFNGVVIDLYREEKPIIESPKNGFLGLLMIGLIVIVVWEAINGLLD